MNADERISVLTMFQTLKAKTSRLLDPVVQAEGLTLLQACVLSHLSQQDAAVGDISDLAVMDQANASSLCKKMEREGFLTRTRRASDRRVVILSLTPKGREAAQRLSAQFDHYLELLNTLPNDAKEELVRGYLAANQMLDYLFEQTKGDRKPC
ncbi:MAG: winged helix DNA-binding protein [Oscillospiraceae bacterium]|nr:winged helix DNA-binding protein [Oscillospiraceae bacterium]